MHNIGEVPDQGSFSLNKACINIEEVKNERVLLLQFASSSEEPGSFSEEE